MTRVDLYTKVVLTMIAGLLAVLAFRPVPHPITVQAQSAAANFYLEPGTNTLRKPDGTGQLQGKVVIDLRNGDAWGFPTLSGAPYPVDPTDTKPPVSEPIYLGRFDFATIKP
ncbi:MAG TPA: hypothetical protein VG096_21235 [Bryobacteraceae bacterium]|nr:hypothetical protein [Bryobacteraceae bacterium]